jgi:hypothetical protein
MLKTILKLKRTLSPETLSPMGWREIGKRIGLTGPGAHYLTRSKLPDIHKRCPQCLRRLEKDLPPEK